jgi:hypothetical protein
MWSLYLSDGLQRNPYWRMVRWNKLCHVPEIWTLMLKYMEQPKICASGGLHLTLLISTSPKWM